MGSFHLTFKVFKFVFVTCSHYGKHNSRSQGICYLGYAPTKMSIRLTAHLLFVWFFNPKLASSKFSLRSSIGSTRITSHRRIILNFMDKRSNFWSFFSSFEIYKFVFGFL
jgi:hypothetical protein